HVLLRKTNFDYGPTPFCFYHYWFELEGFDSFVADTWRDISISEPNFMLRLLKNLKLLKGNIQIWMKDKKDMALNHKKGMKIRLAEIGSSFDKGDVTPDTLEERWNIMNKLTSLKRIDLLELAQKAKVKWSIERDENSTNFHGIINKQRTNLAIRGILEDGAWIEDPKAVRNEFLSHFKDRFNNLCESRLTLDMEFLNKLTIEQMYDLERPFTKEYWNLLEADVGNVVIHIFHNGYCPKGENSSFIALILKSQGAKLSSFIVSKIVDAGFFNGVILNSSLQLSHIFYADDVVFTGQWCDANINTIVRMLECFFRAYGLRINLHKSKLMGIAVENYMVDLAAHNMGCMSLNIPFMYLGVRVGGRMTSINSWDDVINKILCRLSKWKMKTRFIGGRLTLLKSVLGSTPFYYLLMFKAPIQVLRKMESICSHFFNGVNFNDRKMTFVKWDNVLVSKEKGGLGVSSFFAVIKVIHVKDGMLGNSRKSSFSSNWIDIVRDISLLYNKGIDLLGSIKKKIGNGENTMFWEESWKGEVPLKSLRGRTSSAGRLVVNPGGLTLPGMLDRWSWSLTFYGEFSISSAINLIDDRTLKAIASKTSWIKVVPIKVNIHAWRVKLDYLPTRLNLSRRGMDLDSIFCPSCNLAVESTDHIFFGCSMVKEIYKKIACWWDINLLAMSSYEEWWSWFISLHLSTKIKMVLISYFR
ncbi:RNA-directed DNA polymerase, eukaryota, reverse transcriptase zinc-binding domain protein, partial [Tanacetum coccineum]